MQGTVQAPDPYDQKFKLADGQTRDKESLEEKMNSLNDQLEKLSLN